MKNIVLARVDDRLIHTEILTLWVPEVRANRIIIVDDVVAKDKFRSKVIKEMRPKAYNSCIWDRSCNGEIKRSPIL